MLEYGLARPEEERELLDFANYVFSMSGQPTDFLRLQPRVYGRPGFSAITQVARDGKRILGMVSAVTGTLKVGQEQLKYGYIGTVSTHPYARGQGIMKVLMNNTMDALKEQGCHFLALGGQRQRYQHYGFEVAGALLNLSFTVGSLRHTLAADPQNAYSFTPFEETGTEATRLARELHASRAYGCLREEGDFSALMRTWGGKAFVVGRGANALGYLYQVGERVAEFALQEEDCLPCVLADLLASQGRQSLSLTLPAWQAYRYPGLIAAADSMELSPNCNLRVLDWPRYLGALLRFKAGIRPLMPGKASMSIDGAGCFALEVSGCEVHVSLTDEPGDLRLDPMAAIRLSSLYLSRDLYPDTPFLDWFPLPFSFQDADAF